MARLIDSSSFIEAKNRTFCFDVCPGYWDWLEQQITNGQAYSIVQVHSELTQGNDQLAQWAAQHNNGFFLPMDHAATAAMQQVAQWTVSGNFTQSAQSEFLRAADSFLVAYALAHGHTVVTQETFNAAQTSRIKIPVACQHLNVPYQNTLDMLRTEGVRFVLAP